METTCDISFKKWLTEDEAQTYTGFSRSILQKWRNDFLLTYRRLDRKIIYKQSDLDEAMERLQVVKAVNKRTTRNVG